MSIVGHSLLPSNASLFTKNAPDWRIGHTGSVMETIPRLSAKSAKHTVTAGTKNVKIETQLQNKGNLPPQKNIFFWGGGVPFISQLGLYF